MKQPFMSYYEHIAKLSLVANKQTLFLAHVLSRMEYDSTSKQLLVDLTPRVRRLILKELGVTSKNPLNLAKGYIRQLTKAGLIKPLGQGTYCIDPESYGYSKYVPKDLRERAGAIYEETTFHKLEDVVSQVKVIDVITGETIEIVK